MKTELEKAWEAWEELKKVHLQIYLHNTKLEIQRMHLASVEHKLKQEIESKRRTKNEFN